MDGTIDLEHLSARTKGVWHFNFASTGAAKREGTNGKSDADSAILEECMSLASLSLTHGTGGCAGAALL